jgi:hypothetical protein
VVFVIVAVAVVVLAAIALAVLKLRQPPAAEIPVRRSSIAAATPLTGLESALDQVTDRDGRKLREKIEAGTVIDDLRVIDDSGPILRRALDHVEHLDHVDHGRVDAGDLPPATQPEPPGEHSPSDPTPA